MSRPRFAQACLIKRKADPNRVDYHDHSALHYACVWGWVPTVDLLLEEGADPECSNIGAISVSRGAVVPSCRRRDSPPSDGAVGGFAFDFERISGEIATRPVTRRRAKRAHVVCGFFARASH